MHFTGISLTTLLQAGAILGALVVVFYILKLRRRPVPVPFAPLWERILRDKEATSLFSQLKRLLSLLLQLALIALLLTAPGDPRPTVGAHEGRHLVVLLDASASMQAADVGGDPIVPAPGEPPRPRNRLDEARRRVRDMVRGLGSSDRMLLAQMDATVTPLSTMTGEVPELEQALERVQPTEAAADFAHALRFAADALRGLSQPEIVVVSDGALGEPADAAGPIDLGDIALSFLPLGKGAPNVAITGFSVRRYPLDKSRFEVLLEVTNTSAAPADVNLELYGDGKITNVVRLRMAASETLSRFYPNWSGASRTIEAHVTGADGQGDGLPADDRAFALLPERRRARVQVVSKGNMYLDAALLLDEYLDVTTVTPAAYPGQGDASFDVTIFDGVAPPVRPGSGNLLYLDPPADGTVPFKVGKKLESTPKATLGFDEIDGKSPLLRHLSLGDVNVARGHALEPGPDDKVAGRSFEGPLLIQGRRQGNKFVALGFDVRESDLPLRVSWPLFVLNVLDDFLEEDTSYISSFRTGTVWSIPAPSAAKTARLKLPDGSEQVVPVKDGRAVFLGQRAGFYTLTTGEGSEAEQSMFAANMSDPVESHIEPVAELRVGERKAGEPGGFRVGVRKEIWVYLLALGLLITALEWLTYHRRVTV